MSEEDENEYVANSPCGRWSRGEKEGQGKAFGIGGLITKCYHALDLDEGMEVVWNEIEISQAMHNLIRQGGNKGAMDNILKTFKRIEHDNLIKFSGHWIDDSPDDGKFKIVYITEYTSAGTLGSFLRKSRINNKKITARAWRRWCRQILKALNYLHSECAPSITHGHLFCDSIYIHHDGVIKVGPVAPNIIKDFLASLKEGKDFDEKACYKTPNTEDLKHFGNCLLEVFATGVDDLDMQEVVTVYQDHNEQPKKRKKWELSEEEKVVILNSCGEAKAAFIRECYSEQASVAQLLKSPILMEVPPLKVIAFFAVLKHGQTPPENNPNESVQTVIKVNDQPKDHKTKKLDAQRLQNDIDIGMFPLFGIPIPTVPVTPDLGPTEQSSTSEPEHRLILSAICNVDIPKDSEEDEDKRMLSLEFTLEDKMIRKLDTEISLTDDTPVKLTDELINHNLLNEKDRQMVIEAIEEAIES